MSSDIAVRVENLGKRYVIGRETPRPKTLGGRIRQTLASPFSWLTSQMRGPSEEEILWALKDVSFEVKRGEVLGIIGRNGAGKSTLLKILSRITEPTTGYADIHGRVGSLLEVGTGMHPELTGRENIYLNGTILGMRKTEIDSKFDEIIDFSGVERFLDTPVKRYSSGMRVRLGFAIAAHLEPEILIVDEVLAVGDAEFQRKCLGKMKDVAGHGRTVLFVSHSLRSVLSLCTTAVLLSGGEITFADTPEHVVERYLSGTTASEASALPVGDGPLVLQSIHCEDASGSARDWFAYGEDLSVCLRLQSSVEDTWPEVGITVSDSFGTVVFSSNLQDVLRTEEAMAVSGNYLAQVRIPGRLLNTSRYSISAYAHYPRSRVLFQHPACCSFSIEQDGLVPGPLGNDRQGTIRPRLDWALEQL